MKRSEVNWSEAGKKAWATRRANAAKRSKVTPATTTELVKAAAKISDHCRSKKTCVGCTFATAGTCMFFSPGSPDNWDL